MISRADLNFGWIEFPENSIFLTNILSLRSLLIDVCVCLWSKGKNCDVSNRRLTIPLFLLIFFGRIKGRKLKLKLKLNTQWWSFGVIAFERQEEEKVRRALKKSRCPILDLVKSFYRIPHSCVSWISANNMVFPDALSLQKKRCHSVELARQP